MTDSWSPRQHHEFLKWEVIVMKILLVIIVLALGLGLFGCESSPLVRSEDGTFELRHGQTVFVAGPNVHLTFEGEVDDSRCCMSCFCIWPGQGTIRLTLEQNNKSSVIQLGTFVGVHTLPPVYVDTLGYRFELVELNPYPESGPYSNEDYTATVEVTKAPVVTVVPMVQITNSTPPALVLGEYGLDSAKIIDEKLTLWVNYSGGCVEHYFQLFMSPDVFMESNPVQANLYLRHLGPPDACEALVHRKLEFSLHPIQQLFYSGVSGGGGEVRLNLVNCTGVNIPPNVCEVDWSGILNVPSLPD